MKGQPYKINKPAAIFFMLAASCLNKAKVTISFYSAFLSSCIAVYLYETENPMVLKFLELSKSNSWGVFTSLFVHNPIQHLEYNIIAIFVALTVLVCIQCMNPYSINFKNQVFFFLIPLAAAISANILFILQFPYSSSFGSSGFYFAMNGLIIISSSYGIVYYTARLFGTYGLDKLKSMLGLFCNIVFFIIYILPPLIANNIYFMPEPDVNFIVHRYSFVLGTIFSIPFHIKRNLRSHIFRRHSVRR